MLIDFLLVEIGLEDLRGSFTEAPIRTSIIDRLAPVAEPVPDLCQLAHCIGMKTAVSLGPHIEQQIAVLGNYVG